MIDKDKVYEMAELAMIKISEEEAELNRLNISQMMDSIEKIKEVDLEGVEALYNVNNTINPLREDIVGESLDVEEVVKNTVEEQYGHFKILRVMD